MASPSLPPEFQPQTLRQYVGSYGEVTRDALRIDSSRRTTTQGVVVRPEHRLAPTTVRPWTDFENQQAVLWGAVVEATADIKFPCYHHVFETGQELPLIDCEAAVQLCDTDLIHKPASRILNSIGKDQGVNSALSRTLGPRSAVDAAASPGLELGHYFFSTHRNQLNDVIPQLAGSKRTREGELIEPHASSGSDATDGRPEAQERQEQEGEVQEEEAPSLYVPREWAEQQFRAGPTDGFCNFKGVIRNDGLQPTRRILFAYELKAPHKLRWSMIEKAGLASNSTTLDMRRDVWERNDGEDEDEMHDDQDEDPLFATAGVITQLYDFMIRRRIKYGYISTSDTLIFLRLDQRTPSVVEYHTVRRPQRGSSLPSEQMLPTTRVMLLALLSATDQSQLSLEAVDLVKRNNHRWPVTRASTEGTEAFSSAHESRPPGRESTADKSFRLSTASHESGSSVADDLPRNTRCAKRKRSLEDDRAAEAEDGDSSKRCKLQRASDQVEDTATPSLDAKSLPTPPPTHSSLASSPEELSIPTRSRIERALFCTTKCILGVVTGGPMDADCPNSHGHQHPSATDFRQALHDQLTQYSSDMHFLWMGYSGSTGTLFKIRLASLGYVIVAKAGTHTARSALHHEEHIYDEYLRPAQEIGVVPPCLGFMDLPIPWAECETGDELTSCLLLGWVPGQPILGEVPPTQSLMSTSSPAAPDARHASLPHQQEPAKQPLAAALYASIRTAFEVVHRLGVLHGDAALRNIIVMPRGSTGPAQVVLLDFEKAMPCYEWWKTLQKRRTQKRRQRPQLQPQHQVISTADQRARFQAACGREMMRCLDELESVYT